MTEYGRCANPECEKKLPVNRGNRRLYCDDKCRSRAAYLRNPDLYIARATLWNRENASKRQGRKYDSKYRFRRLAKRYGLSPEELAELESRGACDVCARGEDQGVVLVIDHDHERGDVRGILCSQCNVALGLLQDEKERILALARYIQKANRRIAARRK